MEIKTVQTIYILNYNNYYNRILKKEETLEDYQDYVIYTLPETNFVPNDGVNTQHDIGSNAQMYDGSGDYLLVIDGSNTIQSRWFIIDAVRTRGGQYSLTLRRDLLADYKDYVLSNTCFVEKAMLSKNDPMLFNSENMTFNQVKKKEWLLKDASGTAWIVGYLNRSLTEDKAFNIQLPAYYDYSFSTIDDFQAYQTYKSDADNLPRTYDSVSYQIIWNFDYAGEQSLM